MNPLVVFALWTLARSQGGTTLPPARTHNIVRICSLAAGSANPCQDLDARLLEPAPPTATAAAAGQRAFVDPVTRSLVQPNLDQLAELSVILSESMDKRQEEAKVQVLPNGTLRLSGASFTLYSKAVLATTEKEEKP